MAVSQTAIFACKHFLIYFKSVFIKPNKLYINIFINKLIKNSQK